MKIIKDEHQYKVTQSWVRLFSEELEGLERKEHNETDIDPLILKAMKGGIRSWLERLNRQIEDYDCVKAGQVPAWDWSAVERLPEMLVLTRKALCITEKELAEQMGLTEQQIRHFENDDYNTATLSEIRFASMILRNAKREAESSQSVHT